MIYFFIVFFILIGAWFFMVWIRKTMWDAVHRNLLDLEDKLDGKVMRRGFASRPFFHGKYNGYDFTINFSSEKTAGKRLTYVDISYSIQGSVSFSVSEKTWLINQQAEAPLDFSEWQNAAGKTLVLRPVSDKQVQKLLGNETFKNIFNQQDDLAYIFVSKTGLLYEYITEEVIKSTEPDVLINRLQLLNQLKEVIE